jgi:hypothetical protein
MLIDRSPVHGNIDPKLIYSDIKAAQDMYILPLLGTGLYNKIQDLIEAGTIGDNANAEYKTLLDNYIVDALVCYTMAELPMGISYQFWNKGVLRQGGDVTENPTMTELLTIADRYKNRAEWYAERMKRYIKERANNNVLPEYVNPGSGLDIIHPTNTTFSMPFVLGDGCDCDAGWNIPHTKDPDKNCG